MNCSTSRQGTSYLVCVSIQFHSFSVLPYNKNHVLFHTLQATAAWVAGILTHRDNTAKTNLVNVCGTVKQALVVEGLAMRAYAPVSRQVTFRGEVTAPVLSLLDLAKLLNPALYVICVCVCTCVCACVCNCVELHMKICDEVRRDICVVCSCVFSRRL
jgi:hypothetical protein